VSSRAGAAVLIAASLALSAEAQTAAGTDKGKDLYLKYSCWACHGYSGNGGGAVALVPMKMPLAGFTAFVRNPPTMPPYTAKVLSDAQLADIWAYVRTLPESRPAKDIPLLNER
jgi:ubiquinol-cytochrome c reductase cytochrome c subunit